MPWIDDAPNQPSPWRGVRCEYCQLPIADPRCTCNPYEVGGPLHLAPPTPLKEEDVVAAAERAVAVDAVAIASRPTCLHPCIHGTMTSGPWCCACGAPITE